MMLQFVQTYLARFKLLPQARHDITEALTTRLQFGQTLVIDRSTFLEQRRRFVPQSQTH